MLSTAAERSPALLEGEAALMRRLEREGRLDRTVEHLPDDAELARRAQVGAGLSRPALAVLLAYGKIDLRRGAAHDGGTRRPLAAGRPAGRLPGAGRARRRRRAARAAPAAP